MLADVLSAPIMGKEIPFSLSTLKASDRLHEVEFFAPLQLISAGRLGEIFRLLHSISISGCE
jgi:exodeoxyribonuclease V beta subunit